MAARRQKWEAGQQALAEARAQVEALTAERDRYGAPPDAETLRRAQEELNYLNTLHSNRKLAENQLEEAKSAETQAKDAAVDPLFPDLSPDEAWQQASADAETAGRTVPTGGLMGGGIAALVLAAGSLVLALIQVLPAL